MKNNPKKGATCGLLLFIEIDLSANIWQRDQVYMGLYMAADPVQPTKAVQPLDH